MQSLSYACDCIVKHNVTTTNLKAVTSEGSRRYLLYRWLDNVAKFPYRTAILSRTMRATPLGFLKLRIKDVSTDIALPADRRRLRRRGKTKISREDRILSMRNSIARVIGKLINFFR